MYILVAIIALPVGKILTIGYAGEGEKATHLPRKGESR
jgi:hypothetical protein